jgi:lysophospholipase L1-like esterase
MRRHAAITVFIAVALATAPAIRPAVIGAAGGSEQWVGTWSTALHAPDTIVFGTNAGFSNQTVRQVVHTSVGGDRLRVRLSTFGAGTLRLGAAHAAVRAAGAAIVPGTDRTLTFGGRSSVVIPPGATILSDPVDLDVPPLADLAVSLFVPGSTGPATWHFDARQTTYVSPAGDFTGSIDMPVGSEHHSWFWLAGVEVTASRQTGAVVVLGDSLTDGTQSTPDSNSRWTDHLARRLATIRGNHGVGVLNQGLAGNRLLNDIIGANALARYDRDVLTQTGATHVVAFLGNNDILFVFNPLDVVSVDQIINGHRQLIRRAHARGLAIYGATLTPFGGFPLASAQKERMRQAVNDWIRTSGEYDAVFDFDAVVRDPGEPARLRPLFDSGDHLHPNDAGYEAMGHAVDLELFKDDRRR